ncbi:hypothetical protein E5082_13560 [Streptomyces griseoluteus]|uniref:Uncharacterized protein n=1 Tax=Streptomyces griseoluteus TaxID=29306 RepID=A0A4Z1DNB5_STRGP|nr:hypothetical protein [Streptomyces griseoluteus]TGN83866.1 hypothetical protein E5082_13560 [Streptomyces griseoluteus]GHF05819.1 hypothetical protein GCM10017776_24500 [Streptomyces griseoluteus]
MSWSYDRATDYLDAAREMSDSGRHTLARLLAEEAADRTPDPNEAARILAEFPGQSLRQES